MDPILQAVVVSGTIAVLTGICGSGWGWPLWVTGLVAASLSGVCSFVVLL